MPEHSPGPWSYPPQEEFSRDLVVDIDGLAVCSLWSGLERKANGRLIAAAPDLLEALKDCMRWLSACHQGLGTREEMQSSVRYKVYQEIISRATGK